VQRPHDRGILFIHPTNTAADAQNKPEMVNPKLPQPIIDYPHETPERCKGRMTEVSSSTIPSIESNTVRLEGVQSIGVVFIHPTNTAADAQNKPEMVNPKLPQPIIDYPHERPAS
jgi:hypothetical protein